MAFPDDPIGGIWGVRPVGQGGRTAAREKEEAARGEKKARTVRGHDKVTLSQEAKKRALEEGNEQVDGTESSSEG